MSTDNKDASFQYNDLYDETIGFFSDPFYKQEDVKKDSADNTVDVNENIHSAEETNISAVVEAEAKKQIDEPGEQILDEGTYNAFATTIMNNATEIEQSFNEHIKEKNNDKESLVKINDDMVDSVKVSDANKVMNDTQKIVNGIGYDFFAEEKLKILTASKKEQKKNVILCIVCMTLFFLIVPLFLLPVFAFRFFRSKKRLKFNVSVNYSTLKWTLLKEANSYEVYSRIENSDKFKLISIEKQSKSTIQRGKNSYIVIAKKVDSIIAVSELIDVSI